MSTRAPLKVSWTSRAIGAGATLFFASVAALALGVTVTDPLSSVDWLLAVFFGAFLAWLALIEGRITSAKPYIQVQGDHLVVVNAGLLKGPLIIPRSSVSGIAFDDAEHQEDENTRDSPAVCRVFSKQLPTRFQLPDDPGAHLYPGGLAIMPMIGSRLQIPNVAIITKEPLDLASVSRVMAAAMQDNRALLESAATPGLFLRVADTAELRSSVSSWGLDGLPTSADAARMTRLHRRRKPCWRRTV